MRKTCLEMIHELARQDERVIFIGSDLGSGTLQAFKKEFPNRFYMEGICEANILGMATGFALDGKIVYVNTIASFLTRRSYEQIVVDLCMHNANVRLIGNGGGLVYGPLGPTHQAIEDLTIMGILPNMTVIAPADANEMAMLMPETINHNGPIYIRLGKGYDPVVTQNLTNFRIGQAYSYRSGSDALVITTGITLQIALSAADDLKSQGIEISVLHLPTIKPLDKNTIRDFITSIPNVLTVEEHLVNGGLGTLIADLILQTNIPRVKHFTKIGIPNKFSSQYGSQQELMDSYGINIDNIKQKIVKMLSP